MQCLHSTIHKYIYMYVHPNNIYPTTWSGWWRLPWMVLVVWCISSHLVIYYVRRLKLKSQHFWLNWALSSTIIKLLESTTAYNHWSNQPNRLTIFYPVWLGRRSEAFTNFFITSYSSGLATIWFHAWTWVYNYRIRVFICMLEFE